MVLDFLRKFKWRLFLFAFLSLAGIVLIAGIIYFSMPSRYYISQEFEILLRKQSKDGDSVYPNGKKFNRLDIISPSVLKEVYKNNQLENILSYEDFQKSMSVINFSIERALLDADVASKLSKRNLTATDISNVEREYREALSAIDSPVYRIIFAHTSVPPYLSAKILNDTLLTWFRIYSILEADKLPTLTIDSQMETVIAQDLKQSHFIAVDRLRYYMGQFEKLGENLYSLQDNRKLLASSGESLETVMSSIQYTMTYQLSLLRQMVATDAGLHSKLDLIYIQSRLDNEQRRLNALKTQHKMLLDSLAIMENKSIMEEGRAKGSEPSLTLDSGVLTQLSAIFSRDAGNNFRMTLAEQNLVLASSIARQEENVAFYQGILDKLNEASGEGKVENSAENRAEFDRLFQRVLKSIMASGKTLSEFKDLLIGDYASSLQFYVPVGEATWARDSLISFKKLILGAAVTWLLLNIIYGGVLFSANYIRMKPEEL